MDWVINNISQEYEELAQKLNTELQELSSKVNNEMEQMNKRKTRRRFSISALGMFRPRNFNELREFSERPLFDIDFLS